MGSPFPPRGLLLDVARCARASLFPQTWALASQSHTLWRGDHRLLLITSPLFPGRQPLDGTGPRGLKFGLFFLFWLLDHQPVSQFDCTPQETKFYFVIVGIWLSLCLFVRYHDFHASDERENQGGTNDAHYVAMYVLSNMLLRCHLIGALAFYWNEEWNTGSSSKEDKEFVTNCKEISCSLVN